MDKDKERLRSFISLQIKSINRDVLNLAEMLVPNEKWAAFRGKVLDITNKARREIETELETNYNIDYSPAMVCEDIIEVRTGTENGKSSRKSKTTKDF